LVKKGIKSVFYIACIFVVPAMADGDWTPGALGVCNQFWEMREKSVLTDCTFLIGPEQTVSKYYIHQYIYWSKNLKSIKNYMIKPVFIVQAGKQQEWSFYNSHSSRKNKEQNCFLVVVLLWQTILPLPVIFLSFLAL
jgi:hypothetical protein